jgi:hypothetical protein
MPPQLQLYSLRWKLHEQFIKPLTPFAYTLNAKLIESPSYNESPFMNVSMEEWITMKFSKLEDWSFKQEGEIWTIKKMDERDEFGQLTT